MFGIYIHVPFCAKICDYCDFRVMPANARLFEEYAGLLEREIRTFAAAHPVSHSASSQNVLSQARTLYLGGGTPSILPGACLERIFAVLEECGVRVDSLDEVSMEFNPESCTEESIQTALSCGVRRFSLGLQTFSQTLLDRIGRRHTVERGFEALRLLTSLPQAVIILIVSTAARTAAVILFFKLFTLPFYWTLILFIESMPTSEQIREIAPVNSRSVQPTFLQKSTPLMLKYL